jgi:hypothetical protein
MSNIELSIPADLTAAQIIRANPSIDEEAAQKLAAELHDIAACMQKAFALQPSDLPIEDSDAVQTMLRTAVGFWPADKDAWANESVWVMEQITRGRDHGREGSLREVLARVWRGRGRGLRGRGLRQPPVAIRRSVRG